MQFHMVVVSFVAPQINYKVGLATAECFVFAFHGSMESLEPPALQTTLDQVGVRIMHPAACMTCAPLC